MAINLLKLECSLKIFPVPNGIIREFYHKFKEKKVNSSDLSNEFCPIFGGKNPFLYILEKNTGGYNIS